MAWNPTYKLNLLDILKRSIPDSKVQDALRGTVAEYDFRRLYSQRVVDEIVNRTREENIDKKGKPLGKYSKSYRDSLIFQIYHGGDKEVNLTLTGEMLESLRSSYSKYQVTVFLEGQNNRDKAQGHVSGKYGKNGRAPKRDFLGLPPKEEERIFQESIKDYRDLTKLTLTELSI
jgi:phage gpG-like protein